MAKTKDHVAVEDSFQVRRSSRTKCRRVASDEVIEYTFDAETGCRQIKGIVSLSGQSVLNVPQIKLERGVSRLTVRGNIEPSAGGTKRQHSPVKKTKASVVEFTSKKLRKTAAKSATTGKEIKKLIVRKHAGTARAPRRQEPRQENYGLTGYLPEEENSIEIAFKASKAPCGEVPSFQKKQFEFLIPVLPGTRENSTKEKQGPPKSGCSKTSGSSTGTTSSKAETGTEISTQVHSRSTKHDAVIAPKTPKVGKVVTMEPKAQTSVAVRAATFSKTPAAKALAVDKSCRGAIFQNSTVKITQVENQKDSKKGKSCSDTSASVLKSAGNSMVGARTSIVKLARGKSAAEIYREKVNEIRKQSGCYVRRGKSSAKMRERSVDVLRTGKELCSPVVMLDALPFAASSSGLQSRVVGVLKQPAATLTHGAVGLGNYANEGFFVNEVMPAKMEGDDDGVKYQLMERRRHEEAGYLKLEAGARKEACVNTVPLILFVQKGNVRVRMGEEERSVDVCEPGIICIPEGCQYSLEALSGYWDYAALFFVRTRMDNEMPPLP